MKYMIRTPDLHAFFISVPSTDTKLETVPIEAPPITESTSTATPRIFQNIVVCNVLIVYRMGVSKMNLSEMR